MSSSTEIRVQDFDKVVFFTGAGMSVQSGVPTFRGKGGVWKEYDFQSYACQEAFERDPVKVWEFHNYRRKLIGACAPNLGHELIARCEATLPDVQVVTQNIDGLHQQAGSTHVIELHGSMWRVRCDRCARTEEKRVAPLAELHCPCGAWWRPDIVWFGDSLVPAVIEAATEAIRSCNLMVSIGTSAVVFPAAHMPMLARQAGATLVEINPLPTPLSSVYDLCLRGTATEMLSLLCEG